MRSSISAFLKNVYAMVHQKTHSVHIENINIGWRHEKVLDE